MAPSTILRPVRARRPRWLAGAGVLLGACAGVLLGACAGVLLGACAPGGGGAGVDADGDRISDADEGADDAIDSDGDGTPDFRDLDSDGDGVLDRVEAGDDDPATRPVDSDLDLAPDFRDLDSDGNGRPDAIEGEVDGDGDGRGDRTDLDDDGDEIGDADEGAADARDGDGDGTPDFRDVDSDGDGLLDRDETRFDVDLDGLENYRDLDSDGDCRPDAAEAGDADLGTPPPDGDGDGIPDPLDVDSDGDGLRDRDEDLDCDGLLGPGESSAVDADSDGDGASDLVEQAAGTDPLVSGDNPKARGDFVFLAPFDRSPQPALDTLDFETNLIQADVVLSVDTTFSMGEEIDEVKAGLASLVAEVRAAIPDAAFGVAHYEDFPLGFFGEVGDVPFELLHRVMTSSTAAGLASIQGAVDGLALGLGDDPPESGWEALDQLATGAGLVAGGAAVADFDPAAGPPSASAAAALGERVGDVGGAGFRAGSLPVIIQVTDAASHAADGDFPYGFAGPRLRATVLSALSAIGARVVGVVSTGGMAETREDLAQAVRATGALVPPSAFDAARPAACGPGLCCTGIDGAGEAPDGATGRCPLLFSIDGATGAGLSASIIQALQVLADFATLDVGATALDAPGDAVDAVAAFVAEVRPTAAGPAPCATGQAIGAGGFVGVLPGTTVCFELVPRVNKTVAPASLPQLFRAALVVRGNGVAELDRREVFFLVPPDVAQPPIQ